MRTLVHLSDLHFGRVDEALLQPLVERVQALAPDLVVVSGDLTQRAREAQFAAAHAFLQRLPQPQLVVPGNHDVPLYNPLARLLRPLAAYRRHFGDDLAPLYRDDQLAVLGLNTARALVVKNGRINQGQMARVREAMRGLGDEVVKVLVTHHPFDLPQDFDPRQLVGRAQQAMAVFADCGIDVLLAGHLHVSQSVDSGPRYPLAGYGALAVSAGTATSTRARGERNAFNLLKLRPGDVEVQRYAWMPERAAFGRERTQRFERAARGWRAVPVV